MMKQKQRFTSGSYWRILIASLLILLFPLIGLGNENETIISGSEMWDLPRVQTKNIRVNPGAILTITSMLYMDAGTKITIEPGGKLVVDGGTITTSCLDPWLGIEVLGNPGLHQAPTSNQGWVKVINGGTISNALVGIRAGRISNSGLEFTGGIVQVDSAVFLNNQTAIELFPYFGNNISYIRHSTFKTDNYLPESIVADYFIRLYYYAIQDISGCEFRNLRSSPVHSSPARGSGIYAWNSRIYNKCSSLQTPCPPTAYYPNKFYDLYRGIYALSGNPGTIISIIKNEFSNNYRGLYLSGVSNARVTSNDFTYYHGDDTGYCMYIDACTGYWVEDNSFTGNPFGGFGLIINNSGHYPNEIYRNTFQDQKYSISAQGINKHPSSGIGLQILCNYFDDQCLKDIIIIPNFNKTGSGIATNQGSDLPGNPTAMAGNIFNILGAIPNNDFDDINNLGEHITYYYPSLYSDPKVFPLDVTENTVLREQVTFLSQWTFEAGCPPTLMINEGSQEEELLDAIAGWSALASQSEEQLKSMIDAGNTEQLQWDVYMSANPQAMQLYNELMGLSPYLSDTVITNAIFKDEVLINAMLRDILVANPHTAKSAELMNKLDQRWEPLPDFMKEQVMQGINIGTTREALESKHIFYDLKKNVAISKLTHLYHNKADSLGWLNNMYRNTTTGYCYAFGLLAQGYSTQGMDVLNNMTGQSCIELETHSLMIAYYSLLAGLMEQGRSLVQPNNDEISLAWNIYNNATGLPPAYARSLLIAWELLDYEEPIWLPNTYKSGEENIYASSIKPTDRTNPMLTVRPNPANEYLVLSWDVPLGDDAVIIITDVTGRTVYRKGPQTPKDEQIVSLRGWKTGVYTAILKVRKNKQTTTVRFVVSR